VAQGQGTRPQHWGKQLHNLTLVSPFDIVGSLGRFHFFRLLNVMHVSDVFLTFWEYFLGLLEVMSRRG
jgi:hypothetical protein